MNVVVLLTLILTAQAGPDGPVDDAAKPDLHTGQERTSTEATRQAAIAEGKDTDGGLNDELERLNQLKNEIRSILGAVAKREKKKAPEAAVTDETPEAAPPPDEHREPVDPLAAADALYMGGDYAGALAAYDEATGEKADDICWIRLQKANCLRWLGRDAEARVLYQSIITEYPDNFWAPEAEWWLKSIQWEAEYRGK